MENPKSSRLWIVAHIVRVLQVRQVSARDIFLWLAGSPVADSHAFYVNNLIGVSLTLPTIEEPHEVCACSLSLRHAACQVARIGQRDESLADGDCRAVQYPARLCRMQATHFEVAYAAALVPVFQ